MLLAFYPNENVIWAVSEFPMQMWLVVSQFLSFRSETGHLQHSHEAVTEPHTETYIQVFLLTVFFSNLSISPFGVRFLLAALCSQLPDLVSEA